MAHVVAEPCFRYRCMACVDACPVDCFYEGEKMLYIHPAECIDCKKCVSLCPVDAICHEDDLPDEWRPFRDLNATMAVQSVRVTGRSKSSAPQPT